MPAKITGYTVLLHVHLIHKLCLLTALINRHTVAPWIYIFLLHR